MTAPRVARVLAARSAQGSERAGATLHVAPDRILADGPEALAVVSAHRRYEREVGADFAHRAVFAAAGRLARKDRGAVLAFSRQNDVALGLDTLHPGVPAQVALEAGLVGSDDVLLACGSESALLGGLGAVVLKSEPAEMARLLGRETFSVGVPETLRVRLEGRPRPETGPFEWALAVCAALDDEVPDHGRVLELSGPVLERVPDRVALCRALGMLGVAGLVPPDERTRVWLAARHPGVRPSQEASPDDPQTTPDLVVDVGPLRPAAAAAGGGPSLLTGRVDEEPVALADVVLAGSLETLRGAVEVLSERALAPGLGLSVLPDSRPTLVHALEEGLITALVRRGAAILPPGSPLPVALRHERRVVTRPGQAGDILAGPSVAAASAVAGHLSDPDTMRRGHRRAAGPR